MIENVGEVSSTFAGIRRSRYVEKRVEPGGVFVDRLAEKNVFSFGL